MADYILDVTEIEFEHGDRALVHGFEYRHITKQGSTVGQGTVSFRYEIEPVKVHYTVSDKSITDLLVGMSAIVGGTFALALSVENLINQ